MFNKRKSLIFLQFWTSKNSKFHFFFNQCSYPKSIQFSSIKQKQHEWTCLFIRLPIIQGDNCFPWSWTPTTIILMVKTNITILFPYILRTLTGNIGQNMISKTWEIIIQCKTWSFLYVQIIEKQSYVWWLLIVSKISLCTSNVFHI